MRVAVYGLWHLGSVTAACLAEAGHDVVGLDADAATIAGLVANHPPVDEPGLAALIARNRQSGGCTSRPVLPMRYPLLISCGFVSILQWMPKTARACNGSGINWTTSLPTCGQVSWF